MTRALVVALAATLAMLAGAIVVAIWGLGPHHNRMEADRDSRRAHDPALVQRDPLADWLEERFDARRLPRFREAGGL